MHTNQSEECYSENKIIHILVKANLLSVEIGVYHDNTMEQIYTECASDLGLKPNGSSSRKMFKNIRAGKVSTDPNFTCKNLELEEGDTLLIDDCFGLDATIVSHFGIVYNTLYRTQKNQPKERKNYHELYIASSNNTFGYEIKFYIQDSCLYDIIAPFYWMSEWFDDVNPLTNGKHVVMIVNEQSGKCAMPSEFDTLISDFIEGDKEPGRLYVILENEDILGMHLDCFSFDE